MTFKLHSTFYTGEIERGEFERLIRDVIAKEMPGVVVRSFSYDDHGLLVETDAGQIDIEIDWNEIIIKEPNEPTTI